MAYPLPLTEGMVIRGYRVGELAKKTVSESLEDRVPMLAASAAYYFFFSLFPMLLFLAPILSLVGDKERLINSIMDQLSPIVPADGLGVIGAVVRDVVLVEGAPALMSVGALLAAFAASNVINMLTLSLNVAYDVSDPRSFWKRRLLAMVFIILGGIAIALAIPVLLAGEQIINWLGGAVGLEDQTTRLLGWLQYPVIFLVLVVILWLVYHILPATKTSAKHSLVGATIAALLWMVVTLGFRFYVANFAAYNRTYGAIGGIIILLMWMWLTMLALLLGGELNSELHRGTGLVKARRPILRDGRIPTTEETPQPSSQIQQSGSRS